MLNFKLSIMKKVLFALMLLFAGSVITSCTNDQEDEIEFLSIDKDKQECTGCNDNGDN